MAVQGLVMSALFAYVSGSSFVLQGGYGLDEQQFALTFGAGAVGLIGATQLNVRLLRTRTPQQVLPAALAVGVAVGGVLVVTTATGAGGLLGLLLPLFAVLTAVGLALPEQPGPGAVASRRGRRHGRGAARLRAVRAGRRRGAARRGPGQRRPGDGRRHRRLPGGGARRAAGRRAASLAGALSAASTPRSSLGGTAASSADAEQPRQAVPRVGSSGPGRARRWPRRRPRRT